MTLKYFTVVAALVAGASSVAFADNDLITKPSKYSVRETMTKFEAAIKTKAAGG